MRGITTRICFSNIQREFRILKSHCNELEGGREDDKLGKIILSCFLFRPSTIINGLPKVAPKVRVGEEH